MRICQGKIDLSGKQVYPEPNESPSRSSKKQVKLAVDDSQIHSRCTCGAKSNLRHKSFFISKTEVFDYKPNCHVKQMLENNKKWVAETKKKFPDFFENLSKPQKPKILYFGCADSRVSANEILGLGNKDFNQTRRCVCAQKHRKSYSGSDLNALSVLEYAVSVLDVTDIIVTGHYDCGAVKAASGHQDLGMLEHWLRQIRDVRRLHNDYLDEIESPEDQHVALVELNVVEQCLNLFKTGVVQRRRIQVREQLQREVQQTKQKLMTEASTVEVSNRDDSEVYSFSEESLSLKASAHLVESINKLGISSFVSCNSNDCSDEKVANSSLSNEVDKLATNGNIPVPLCPELEEEVYPRIHGLVFNPGDGLLKKLNVNFKKRVGSMEHIYGLYK